MHRNIIHCKILVANNRIFVFNWFNSYNSCCNKGCKCWRKFWWEKKDRKYWIKDTSKPLGWIWWMLFCVSESFLKIIKQTLFWRSINNVRICVTIQNEIPTNFYLIFGAVQRKFFFFFPSSALDRDISFWIFI